MVLEVTPRGTETKMDVKCKISFITDPAIPFGKEKYLDQILMDVLCKLLLHFVSCQTFLTFLPPPVTPKIKGTIDTQTVEVGNPLKIKIPYRGQGDVIASIALEGQPIEGA